MVKRDHALLVRLPHSLRSCQFRSGVRHSGNSAPERERIHREDLPPAPAAIGAAASAGTVLGKRESLLKNAAITAQHTDYLRRVPSRGGCFLGCFRFLVHAGTRADRVPYVFAIRPCKFRTPPRFRHAVSSVHDVVAPFCSKYSSLVVLWHEILAAQSDSAEENSFCVLVRSPGYSG